MTGAIDYLQYFISQLDIDGVVASSQSSVIGDSVQFYTSSGLRLIVKGRGLQLE